MVIAYKKTLKNVIKDIKKGTSEKIGQFAF